MIFIISDSDFNSNSNHKKNAQRDTGHFFLVRVEIIIE